MKSGIMFLILFVSMKILYSNPIGPSLRINEFGFNDRGWIMELTSEYWEPSLKIHIISDSDTSDYFRIYPGDYNHFYYVLTSDSLGNNFHINPAGDRIVISDSFGSFFTTLVFGKNETDGVVDTLENGQSICYWQKPQGKIFYYLDNTPTFGFANDSLNAFGKITGILKDTLGNPIADAKVFYDYETLYGAGDIYTVTNDSGYFFIDDFAEKVLLRFKKDYFFDKKINIQIYPDSTINLEIMLNTNISYIALQSNNLFNFVLEQNYPNPFNPETKIKYSVPGSLGEHYRVNLKLYNILGNLIAVLLNEYQSTGEHEIVFDASKYSLSSGVYFYVLRAKNRLISRKMCYIK